MIYTVVAVAGSAGHYQQKDWRPLGVFKNDQACLHATRLLKLGRDRAVCVPTDTKPRNKP